MKKTGSCSMKFLLAALITAGALCCSQVHSKESLDGEPVSIGIYREMHSEILNKERLLLVCLPEDYEESSMAYPVLYVLYGGQVRGYFAEAVHIVSRLSEEGSIPRMIVVGVANVDRYRDLSPIGRRGNPSGIEPFTDFVEKELVPFVERDYRTKDYRVLVGPQAGAAFGLYTIANRPGLFDAFILENPFRSEPVRDVLVPMMETLLEEGLPGYTFVQISCADREGYLDKTEEVEYAREFQRRIEERDPCNLTLIAHYLGEIPDFLPPIMLREGLRELFGEYAFPDDQPVEGLPDIVSYYAALSEKLGFEIDIPEKVLADEALELAEAGESDAAIEILEYLIGLYPSSLNGYWRLANIFIGLGDREKAIQHLRKCLEIMPGMPPALHWLERLKAEE